MKPKPRVLVIDDEPAMVGWLETLLQQAGYDVSSAGVGELGAQRLTAWQPAAIVTDLRLPDVDGIELVRRFKQLDPTVCVIVITGQGDIPRSVEAIKAGAFDFLEKPVEPALLLGRLDRALKQRVLESENAHLARQLQDGGRFQRIVGVSDKMRALFDLIDCVAGSEANILIQGESGTGKELIADAIHENSRRASRPFIKINCAAIPEELIESELFGYKRGAFTGAMTDKPGLFELAEGGSLLLDEIGEMSPYLQTKLLRVLQEREFRRIGGDRIVRLDVRLVCSTNIDLEKARRDGALREDLYFRINTVTLSVPPLRERTEDIPLLCERFLKKFSQKHRQGQPEVRGLTPAARRALKDYRWPGNVRELENVIERGVLMAKGVEVDVVDLPEHLRGQASDGDASACKTLAEIEKMAIIQTLELTQWNKTEAAELLGVYRPTLHSKIRKYNIRQDVQHQPHV